MGWQQGWRRHHRQQHAREAAAAAEAAEEAERAAARARLLDLARTSANWHSPTVPLPTDRPLLTPGQAWRSSEAVSGDGPRAGPRRGW